MISAILKFTNNQAPLPSSSFILFSTTMAITSSQKDLLDKLQTNYANGLTTGEASQRRSTSGGGLNNVRPPLNCP